MLTKSKFLVGMACPRTMWYAENDKQKLLPIPEKVRARMQQGTNVGAYAQKCFDGRTVNGIVKEVKGTVFEAAAKTEELYARSDVLQSSADGLNLIEVKSSTRVKEEHIFDVAFQKHVFEKAGFKINKCVLMHVNNKYEKQGEIEPQKLFHQHDITREVETIKVEEMIAEFLTILSKAEPPPRCKSPNTCPQPHLCWPDLPPHSVFELHRNNGIDLAEQGILKIENIPQDYELTAKQKIQVMGQEHVEKEKISEFLKLEEPIHYLDFETFATAIPIIDGTHPYEAIPFQYSLHIGKEHKEFLADTKEDPRKAFLESLKKDIQEKGSIVVYNAAFEKNILRKLANKHPAYKAWTESLMPRIVDLHEPFKQFWYYHPRQKGSTSIKAVLPVLTETSYKELEIGDGETALREYERITYGQTSEEEKQKVRKALLEYCKLDTKAMKDIVEALWHISK